MQQRIGHRTTPSGHNLRRSGDLLRIVPCVLLALIALSCGSQPGPMTGTWFLTMISNGSLDQAVANLNLHQSGDTVSGTITSVLCKVPADVRGTLSGNTITLQIVQQDTAGTLSGSLNDNFTFASGQYQIKGDWCAQHLSLGTWSAAFVSS